MWIVKLALRRPYTFLVVAFLLILAGVGASIKMPRDIFPAINEPVVTVVWNYPGFPPEDMANQISQWSEFLTTQFVGNIKNIESRNVFGFSVIRLYFQPGVDIGGAMAQVTSVSQTVLKRMPLGTTPPYILVYDPSSVPVMLVALDSQEMSEAELFDFGMFTVRQALSPVAGAQLPLPYGGTPRVITIDLDPVRMQAYGVTPSDVNRALNSQNLILPTGSVMIDKTEYMLKVNSSPSTMELLNKVPVKSINGSLVYIEDIGHARDGYLPQTNMIRYNGHKSALVSVGKSGNVSTLDVIAQAKSVLEKIPTPADLKFSVLFDQSPFVTGAIQGVIIEGLTAASLTCLLILLFLGSWRSMVVVVVSIPVCVFTSIFILHSLGHTLNLMTLGGLALSVGILVDDATVTVENIHRHLEMRKNLIQSILDGAREISIPAFVSTLCICIVFFPVGLLTGAPKHLFVPMALAVVFAIVTSYFLSRTLVPVLTHYLMRGMPSHGDHAASGAKQNIFARISLNFERGFETFKKRYLSILQWSLFNPKKIFSIFGLATLIACASLPFVGRDFFPTIDAGELRLHVLAPTGTRIEETAIYFSQVEEAIRELAGSDIAVILDNIGIPPPNNIALSDNVTVSSADGEILIALKPERTRSAQEYMRLLRVLLPEKFPNLSFYFQPGDMMNQILNLGLPTPIDVRVFGLASEDVLFNFAKQIEERMLKIPGAVDVHIQQRRDQPTLNINVDRERAAQMNFTQRDIAENVLIQASSSLMVTPNFWTDPKSGHTYNIVVQTPLDKLTSFDDVVNTPLPASGKSQTQYLGNVASVTRGQTSAQVSHTNVLNTFNVMSNIQGRDTGSVSAQIKQIIKELSKDLPKGVSIELGGQARMMDQAFMQLGIGLLGAILLVYLILVINFQSLTDPLIIIMALPGAFCGIIMMLLFTSTTFSVPSLMGSIMTVGVATANGILVISFANELLHSGKTSMHAALEAGQARLRPVVMTALAMIVGMIPMALGLSEGGEQNAPLGRAVIGGMLLASVATLILVPVTFSLLRKNWIPPAPEQGDELLV